MYTPTYYMCMKEIMVMRLPAYKNLNIHTYKKFVLNHRKVYKNKSEYEITQLEKYVQMTHGGKNEL